MQVILVHIYMQQRNKTPGFETNIEIRDEARFLLYDPQTEFNDKNWF